MALVLRDRLLLPVCVPAEGWSSSCSRPRNRRSGGESCWGDSVMKEVEEEEEGGEQWAHCLGSVVGA